MEIFDTTQLPIDGEGLSQSQVYWLYNGLDCCLTAELRHKLTALLDDVSRATYQRALELQAPLLEMMLRGLNVDDNHVARLIASSEDELAFLEKRFNRLCVEGLGMTAAPNWNSPAQMNGFFYGTLNLPEIKKCNANGINTPTTDREALEKLTQYFIAEPFVAHILAMRDIGKRLGFLRTKLDSDGRIRCNFNLAGTNTGRLSSSFSDMGTGTNLQNVDRNLRYIFTADPGKIFINIDLEQADSRNVGALCWNLFHDSHGPEFAGSYLDACESGDLHTTVCRMAWGELEWGDDPKKWRGIADQIAYRTYSYRDMAKKLGHGTNYLGQPKTMAMHTKVPAQQIAYFQSKYFGAFPCIPEWHKHTIETLQTTGSLTHLFGRRRYFFNRLDDQSTINAAIAYCPQGMTGDEINEGLLALWRHGAFELLVQVHDSILFQCDVTAVNELVPIALKLAQVSCTLAGGRVFTVPVEAKVGWNWGDKSADNYWGLAKWKGEETREIPPVHRQRRASIRSLL